MRPTAAEREYARNRVDLLLLNLRGDIVEDHRMQTWDINRSVGELVGAFRDAHGYTPLLRVRFVGTHRVADHLLPPVWRDRSVGSWAGPWPDDEQEDTGAEA